MIRTDTAVPPASPLQASRATAGEAPAPSGDEVRLGERPQGAKTIGERLAGRFSTKEVYRQLDRALKALRTAPLTTVARESLEAYARSLPLVDLHRHLEGAITPEAALRVAQKHGIELPTYDLEQLRPLMQITPEDANCKPEDALKVFLTKFDVIGKLFQSPAAIEDLSYEVVQEARRENLEYVELRFSPMYIAASRGVEIEEATKAVLRGVERGAKDAGIHVSALMIIERQMGVDNGWIVEKLAEKYKDRGVVALDLANNEYDYPPGPYAEVFQAAKKAGLKVTVHAGEVPKHHAIPGIGGAHNIRVAVEELGADRIGHGARAHEDPEVERLMIERQIPFEINPTSNVQTQAVASMEQHPLERYYRAGAKVTINNDDPAVSAITLGQDYANIAGTFGYSTADLRTFVENGIDAAFTSEEVKADVRSRVEEGFRQAEQGLVESLTVEELRRAALAGAGSEEEAAAVRAELDRFEDWLINP